MTLLDLKKQQFWVGGQIAASVPLQIGFLLLGYNYLSIALPTSDAMIGRLVYTIQWDFWGAVVLLAMIAFLAGVRPLRLDTIDGNDKTALELHVRVQRNTVEQLLLMIIGHLALATILEPDQLRIIPVLVLLFIASRIIYWIGYVRAPHLRTFGFVATFYPNIGVLLYTAWHLLEL
jgi:MAPEG family